MRPLRTFGQQHITTYVSWSPDGTKLLTANADYSVRVWDAHNSTLLATLNAHTKPVNSVGWSPDGSKFASVGDDGNLVIWDSKTYKPLRVIQYSAPLSFVAWSPDGSKIAASVTTVSIQIWDVQGNGVDSIAQGFSINSLSWRPDSKAIMGDDSYIINISDNNIIPFTGCTSDYTTAWSHNGQLIVQSGPTGAGGVLCFADASTGAILGGFDIDEEAHFLEFSPDDRQLAAVGPDGRVSIWDVKTMKVLYDWPAPKTDNALVPAAAVAKLQLTAVCSPNPDQYRLWKVVNANPYDVTFRWFVVNSPTKQVGDEVVAASQNGKPGTLIFQTNTEAGDNTLNVFSPPDKLQATASSTTERCAVPTPAATAASS